MIEVEIFQIDCKRCNQEKCFNKFLGLNSTDEKLKRDCYINVYSFNVENIKNKKEFLETVFQKFNVNHPEDFEGHSLSVSDVVNIKKNNEVNSFYCDSVGFEKIDWFNN